MKPYLSIVTVSRNDGHGGNIMKRMKLFMNGLFYQTRKYNLPVELIMVEWNPPEGKPLLSEVLPKPGPEDVMTTRYIVVPNAIHQRFKRRDVIPLFQMIGKNVGIRRAKGEFILCTNIDLLFSHELFQWLADKKLDKSKFYRANRCDIPDKLELDWDFEKQLTFAENNIMTRLGKDYRYLNLFNVHPIFYKSAIVTRVLNVLYGWYRDLFEGKPQRIFNNLDTAACGDFTLMHRDAWLDMQGYLELDLYSIHIDTFGLISARSLGYEQVILPPTACSYHIDHPTGWEAMTPIQKIKFAEERPGVGFDVAWETAMYMMVNKTRYDINPEDWGYANDALPETVFPAPKG